MKPTLDIITVTKDDFEGIKRTIESTREIRSAGAIQFVVDGSSDGVRERVEELCTREDNIEYKWLEPGGISAAFNMGLGMSSADWVWCLNGGDRVHRSVKSEKLLYILRESRADALIFELERMQSGKRLRHPPMWDLWPPVFVWIPHPSTLVRRRLFERYGLFDESYKIAMDAELWLRLFSRDDVVVDMVSIPIALYDESGMSNVQVSETAKETRRAIKSHLWMIIRRWLLSSRKIFDAWLHYGKDIS